MTEHEDDWIEYRRLILAELKRLSEGQDKLQEGMGDIRTDVSGLKIRVGLYAGVAATAVSIIVSVILAYVRSGGL